MKRFRQSELSSLDGKSYYLKDTQGNVYVTVDNIGITVGVNDLAKNENFLNALKKTNGEDYKCNFYLTTAITQEQIEEIGRSVDIKEAYLVQPLQKILSGENNQTGPKDLVEK